LLATRILHVSLAIKSRIGFGLVKINSGCTQPDYTLAPESPPQINIEKQVVWLLATRILHVSLAIKRDPSFGLVKINSGCMQPDYSLLALFASIAKPW
jgi:hypothetical protein